ncbi:MAG: AMP-binding protein [Anaerolineaceae bacterium]|nr:AMP-binding protein [Anaerolineaceae bacterium]
MSENGIFEGFVQWPDEDIARYKREGIWEGLTLGEIMDQWVQKYRDRSAISYRGKDITYTEMDEYATRIAYHLILSGIKTYDPVIIQLFNSPEVAYLVYACFKIGAIPICSLPTYRRTEIEYIAKEANARVLAIPPGNYKDFDYEKFAEEIRQAAPSLKIVLTVGKPERANNISINDIMVYSNVNLTKAKEEFKKYKPDPMMPALFQMSGGTTGVPKMIPRTHNDYYYNTKCAANALDFDKKTRILIGSPMLHNLAFVNGVLPAFYKGGTVALTPSYSPESMLQGVAENKADTIVTVPVLMHRMLEVPDEVRAKYDLSSLKQFLWGGNRIEPEIQLKFREVYRCDTNQTYGMAEGLIMWTRPSDPLNTKLYTQGKPVSTADDVKIVEINTRQEVSVGQVGELICRGPYTLRGYYKSPARNIEVFTADGYYCTGDLVRKDGEGNYTVAGRIKDCISRGAEKINAEEVETHIGAFDKVKAVAVVAMPDKVMGERVCAFIVPKPGSIFSLEELNNFLIKERQIAKCKIPERIEFIDELPLSNVGKFEKKSLREKITAILEKEASSTY